MKDDRPVNVSKLVRNEPAMRRAIQQGTANARQARKRAGLPVAEWRDGKVTWIPADQIEEAKPARGKSAPTGMDRVSARAPKRKPKKPATRSRRG